VGTSELNLEQKHRLDGWGRYFHFNRVNDSVHTTRTDITGITVDGKAVAAVVVSGGPDQAIESGNTGSPYATAGDDILLPIPVTEQALAKAIDDLRELQDKTGAFDKIFAGVDNNSSAGTDESGCVASIDCPLGITGNDPNCGTATLDEIGDYGACGYTVTSAVAFISDFYSLGTSILLDPWLNDYVWGDASTYGPTDPRYHKFFSAGPNSTAGDSDDIVP
jgi:hypothetical protein